MFDVGFGTEIIRNDFSIFFFLFFHSELGPRVRRMSMTWEMALGVCPYVLVINGSEDGMKKVDR